MMRHCLVDNGNRRGTDSVVGIEVPPGQHWGPHRLEIVSADLVEERDRVHGRLRRESVDEHFLIPSAIAEGRGLRETRRGDAGQRSYPSEQGICLHETFV